jgi:hypothetical protein
MSDKLLPCPFCEGDGKQLNGLCDYIKCQGCGAIAGVDVWNTRAPQAASEGKVFCQVKGHDFEDANNCVFCATDSVTISRECAESLLAALDKGVSVYMDYDAITKLFGELKQALEANPMQVTGGLCE